MPLLATITALDILPYRDCPWLWPAENTGLALFVKRNKWWKMIRGDIVALVREKKFIHPPCHLKRSPCLYYGLLKWLPISGVVLEEWFQQILSSFPPVRNKSRKTKSWGMPRDAGGQKDRQNSPLKKRDQKKSVANRISQSAVACGTVTSRLLFCPH